MKLDRKYEIERVASKDIARPHLHGVYLDTSEVQALLVATNGHAMAVVPCDADKDSDVGGILPIECMKGARTSTIGVQVGADSVSHLADGVTLARDKNGQFPPWRQVVPKADRRETVVSFNAALLLDLAKAIGAKGRAGACLVTLRIAVDKDGGIIPLDPIRVESDGEAYGVLMPCRM